MANIRVTCPTCGKALEVGAEFEGQEVECGECFQVFVAKGPGGRIKGAPSARGKAPAGKTADKPAGKPKSPGRKRDDENDEYEHDKRDEYDDEDYDPPDRGRRRGGGGGGPPGMRAAGATLALGIVSFVFACIPIIGIPVAIVTLTGPNAANYPPGQAGLVRAGKVLAQITIGLLVFVIAAAYYLIRER